MAFAAFADAPVDVAVIEVGLGGTWDATNVADGGVAVITPIDLDHTHLLGTTVAEIAREKAGIIKPGAHAILAGQSLEAAQVLLERCAEVGALPQREGIDFGVLGRQLAVDGQLVRLNGAEGPVEDVFIPLHGAHQASNAGLALAAVEAFLGLKAVNPDVVREGFAHVTVPGRLEVVRRSPTVLLDAAHNPHGAAAAVAALDEAFDLNPLVGVIGVMADKDVRGLLETFEPVADPRRGHPGRPRRAAGCRPRSSASWRRRSSAPSGSRSRPGSTTRIEAAVGLAEGEGVGTPGRAGQRVGRAGRRGPQPAGAAGGRRRAAAAEAGGTRRGLGRTTGRPAVEAPTDEERRAD